jgi:hypothetical protein
MAFSSHSGLVKSMDGKGEFNTFLGHEIILYIDQKNNWE